MRRFARALTRRSVRILESIWQSAASGAEKWEVIRDGLTDAGQSVLGWENRRQPDWFKESASVLERCIEKRSMLFRRWLRSGRNSDRQKYVAQRKTVAGAVKRAKNDWLQQKAKAVEAWMMSGTLRWGCLAKYERDTMGSAGIRPVMTKVIKKSNGEMCVGRDEETALLEKALQEQFSTSGVPTLRMSSMKYLTAPLMRVWMHHHLMMR